MGSSCQAVDQSTHYFTFTSDMAQSAHLQPALLVSLTTLLLLSPSAGRHGRTMRTGRLSTDEMRIVHGMMEVLQPPVDMFPHRGASDRCNLGSKSYCPGEVLFKVGKKNLKAKICTPSGKFDLVPIPRSYKEPQRCQHRNTEYCDGEMLRGFMAWSFVQHCKNGRLELLAMHHA